MFPVGLKSLRQGTSSHLITEQGVLHFFVQNCMDKATDEKEESTYNMYSSYS